MALDCNKPIILEEKLNEVSDKELENYLSDDALKDFLKTIKKHKVPTNEENIKLCEKAQNGDIESRNLLIEHNLRLVVAIAFRDRHKLTSYEKLDIIQEGVIGLMKGIERFDKTKECKFSTYVIYWIKQAINEGIYYRDSSIYIPVSLKRNVLRYNQIREEYLRNKKKLPTDREWLDILEISAETLRNIKEATKLDVDSLNRHIENKEEDNDNELVDFIETEETGYTKLINNMIDNELKLFLKIILPPHYYYVLYHTILSNDKNTLEFIGKKFNLTKERIRQIQSQSLRTIRIYYRKSDFSIKDYLIKNNIKNVDNYSSEPINYLDIIKYLYVRDYLTKEEQTILKNYLFNYEKKYLIFLSKDFNIDIENMKIFLIKTLQKVKAIITEEDTLFQEFSNNILKKYGIKIFSLNLEIDVTKLKENPSLIRIKK